MRGRTPAQTPMKSSMRSCGPSLRSSHQVVMPAPSTSSMATNGCSSPVVPTSYRAATLGWLSRARAWPLRGEALALPQVVKGADHLERHPAANRFLLLGEIDGPHPSPAQDLDDSVRADPGRQGLPRRPEARLGGLSVVRQLRGVGQVGDCRHVEETGLGLFTQHRHELVAQPSVSGAGIVDEALTSVTLELESFAQKLQETAFALDLVEGGFSLRWRRLAVNGLSAF